MALIDELDDVFWTLDEFAEEAEIRQQGQDETESLTIKVIYENAVTQEEDTYARRDSIHPHITTRTEFVKDYGEGDLVKVRGETREILDSLRDHSMTTFTLSE